MDTENPDGVVPPGGLIQPSPLAAAVMLQPAETSPDDQAYVILLMETVHGTATYLLDPQTALEVGSRLAQGARQIMPLETLGLVVPSHGRS